MLTDLIPSDDSRIANVRWVNGNNGTAYFDVIKQSDHEGIVMKKTSSSYKINKRSSDWLKVINYQYGDVFITGLRKDQFGLLLFF